MKKYLAMSAMFKTRLELLLSTLESAQTRYDVVKEDCRQKTSFTFGLEYTWNSSIYLIYSNYFILQEHQGFLQTNFLDFESLV